jgi:hypothetical protein
MGTIQKERTLKKLCKLESPNLTDDEIENVTEVISYDVSQVK